jgi:hypothetical protein
MTSGIHSRLKTLKIANSLRPVAHSAPCHTFESETAYRR